MKHPVIPAALLTVVLLSGACRGGAYRKNETHAEVSDESITRGAVLAATYCGSCHQQPTPDLLDSKSWENGVLPQMGPRLGIFQYRNQRYPNNIGDPNVGRGAYPDSAVLSVADWGAIVDYYTAVSPDSLPPQRRDEGIRQDTTSFRVEEAARGGGAPGTPPATCFIRYEPELHRVLTSDVLTHTLESWDSVLRPVNSFLIGGSIVDIIPDSAGYLACNIGPFGPNNAPAGHIDRLTPPLHIAASGRPLPIVYDSLLRPVSIAAADLNGDGRRDLVVSEFGFIKGELVWLENKGDGRYEKHVLRSLPGAIRVEIQDYNHDGLPDIWALFAQGDECLMLYTNQGHGQFSGQQVLRWPPSYGSSYFELDDLNKDGYPDIVYTCGDNGDYSTVLKPYHGVYIYMNDGHGHFTRQYFFPMNGCYRAMARDFDGDGDMDIACIAYFADYRRQPEEGFVYLENGGGMKFHPYTIPGTERGRWITMDIADTDGDGKPDILLANCSVGPGFTAGATDWKKGPPFMVLHNKISLADEKKHSYTGFPGR
jgi:mono/diheme cytochrome c family protein